MIKRNKIINFLILLFLINPISCVQPGAVGITPKIANLENDMSNLKDLVNQNAEKIDNALVSINNATTNVADEIHSGGGWIVLAAILLSIIFTIALIRFAKYALRLYKADNSLKLVSTAIKNTDESTSRTIRNQIEYEVNNGGPFSIKNKKQLLDLVQQYGNKISN